MNVYIRYFDNEKVCLNTEELFDFVQNIEGINFDEQMRQDILDYIAGKYSFAKRFRVSQRSYFILIKTTATTMQEFKEYSMRGGDNNRNQDNNEKDYLAQIFNEERVGWYDAYVSFKRVVSSQTGKSQYVDTEFRAKLKATCVQDCYNRVMNHLRNRADVDSRSQLPSIKGRNFQAKFLGLEG